MAKNAFTSKTVLASGVSFISGVGMLALGFLTDPATVKNATEYAERNGRSDIANILKDFVLPTVAGLTALTAMAGRFDVGDLWTPKGLPGKNKEDFASELTLQEVMATVMDAKDAALAANNAERIDKIADVLVNLESRLSSDSARISPPATFERTSLDSDAVEQPQQPPKWTRQLPTWIDLPGEEPGLENDDRTLEGY